jgi:hypothetical protein
MSAIKQQSLRVTTSSSVSPSTKGLFIASLFRSAEGYKTQVMAHKSGNGACTRQSKCFLTAIPFDTSTTWGNAKSAGKAISKIFSTSASCG